jgi:hypothetical protein
MWNDEAPLCSWFNFINAEAALIPEHLRGSVELKFVVSNGQDSLAAEQV